MTDHQRWIFQGWRDGTRLTGCRPLVVFFRPCR